MAAIIEGYRIVETKACKFRLQYQSMNYIFMQREWWFFGETSETFEDAVQQLLEFGKNRDNEIIVKEYYEY